MVRQLILINSDDFSKAMLKFPCDRGVHTVQGSAREM